MTARNECKDLLTRYGIARIPFISLHTVERARALGLLKEVAAELSLPFCIHTLSKGVSSPRFLIFRAIRVTRGSCSTS